MKQSLTPSTILFSVCLASSNTWAGDPTYESTVYIQTALKQSGLYTGEVDGLCDDETIALVLNYVNERNPQNNGAWQKCDYITLNYQLWFSEEYGEKLAIDLGFQVIGDEIFQKWADRCNGNVFPKTRGQLVSAHVINFQLRKTFEAQDSSIPLEVLKERIELFDCATEVVREANR